jgi:hypothetical protein
MKEDILGVSFTLRPPLHRIRPVDSFQIGHPLRPGFIDQQRGRLSATTSATHSLLRDHYDVCYAGDFSHLQLRLALFENTFIPPCPLGKTPAGAAWAKRWPKINLGGICSKPQVSELSMAQGKEQQADHHNSHAGPGNIIDCEGAGIRAADVDSVSSRLIAAYAEGNRCGSSAVDRDTRRL